MIDESSEIAAFGGIDDRVGINAKHVVRIDSLQFVMLLPEVTDTLSNSFANVFDNHVFHGDRFTSEETPRVNT